MRILLGALSLLSAVLIASAGIGRGDEPASAIALSLAWAAVYLVLGLLAVVRPVRGVFTATAVFNGVVGVILGFLWFVARNFTDSQASFDLWILPFVILQLATAVVALIARARSPGRQPGRAAR